MQPHWLKLEKMLHHILYGWWSNNQGWDIAMEQEFMYLMDWEYINESKCAAYSASLRPNRQLKGCVAITISYVKTGLVKQIQNVGKWVPHAKNLTKSRPP